MFKLLSFSLLYEVYAYNITKPEYIHILHNGTWMDGLRFYGIFNSISVRLRRIEGDNIMKGCVQ